MNIPKLIVPDLVKNAAALAMGLPTYVKIMKMYTGGRSLLGDDGGGFQKAFNAFYKVRRDKSWRKKFYEIFEDFRTGHERSFREVLEELSKEKTRYGQMFVDASFVSKMFATVDPMNPIVDSFVLKTIGEKLSEGSREEKLAYADSLYTELKKKVECYLQSEDGRSLIAKFDEIFPEYKDVSPVKKLDCLMWQYGNDLSNEVVRV